MYFFLFLTPYRILELQRRGSSGRFTVVLHRYFKPLILALIGVPLSLVQQPRSEHRDSDRLFSENVRNEFDATTRANVNRLSVRFAIHRETIHRNVVPPRCS